MVSDSVLDSSLVLAFRETHYHVNSAERFALRIGEQSPSLAALHTQFHCSSSAYVTACNPYSNNVGSKTNEDLHRELGNALARDGCVFIEGVGQHPTGEWPGEPSFLVFGLSLLEASRLGRELKQNAILWSDADAVPQLVLLR